jgi:hypothetical protein
VLFVNVPIGIVVAAAAPRVLAGSPRRPGRIGAAGAVTGTGGIALLVYGLSRAAAGPDGVSHWGDAPVLVSLAVSAVLLVSFVLIEIRSPRPLLPMRVLADRNRSGAYLIMLCVATGLFGLFFFLTLFLQSVLGYSPIRSGLAYLPFAVGVVSASTLASRLMARIGARPLILAGVAAAAGGTFWFSRPTEHSGYLGQLLGPLLLTSFGSAWCSSRCPWSPCTTWRIRIPVSPPACSTLGSKLVARSGWPCSAPSPGPPSRTLPGRPPTPTRWRPAFPVGSTSPPGSRCWPCWSRSPPSGSAARN